MHERREDGPEPTAAATQEPEELTLAFLDPARLSFRRQGTVLRLTIAEDRSYLRAAVRRVLPITHSDGFYSIRDAQDKEIGLLRSTGGLDAESRAAVEADLERRYLIPLIRRVVHATERFGVVDWTVETNRGERKFSTRNLRDNVVNPSPGRYLLTDVDGNRYEVEDLAALDAPSRNHFMQHI